jgi:hypothetical protein
VKSVDGKVRVAKEGLALLGKIPDKIRKGFYVKALAERLDIQESFLHEMLRSSPKKPSKAGEDLKKPSMERSFPKSEKMVVCLMIHHPEFVPILSKEGIFKEFESPVLRKMAEALEDLYQRKGRVDLPEVLANFEEDLKGRLCELAFEESGLEGNWEKILKDCIQKIRDERIKKEKGELQKRIKEADKQQEGIGLNPLLEQKLELARRREKGLQ